MRARHVTLVCLVMLSALAGCATDTGAGFRSAVAADHPLASEAGLAVLEKGGNAVDAAVATSFALSVVRPYSCGVGGGGFMLIHLDDHPEHGTRDVALNYRETCPSGVDETYFEDRPDEASRSGGAAVAVPGSVAGLLHALENYGTLDRAAVLEEAIRLAEEGFTVDAYYAQHAADLIERFNEHPSWKDDYAFVWQRFLKEGTIERGDRITLPEQAELLRRIARDGRNAFYTGRVAQAMIRAVQTSGGELSIADLHNYQVRETEPIRASFAEWDLLLMPPPSSGGVALAETLGVLENTAFDTGASDPLSDTENLHLLAEALKHAFADRARHLADPLYADVPTDGLLRPAYHEELASRIDPERTFGRDHYGIQISLPQDTGTSHFCVVDEDGNAVSCTETINRIFGSLVPVPEFGFCLNNEMNDFTTKRGQANSFGLIQSPKNLPEPGKRPLSSMSPTIVLDGNGNVFALAGASGGPRIITGTLQALLRVLVADMPAGLAVVLPRIHHQWVPDTLRLERSIEAWPGGIVDGLRRRGHELEAIGTIGAVQLIRRHPSGKGWQAASDPRKGGEPAGN